MTAQECLEGLKYDATQDIILNSKGSYTLYLWNNVTNDMQGREEIYKYVVDAINEKIGRDTHA